MHLMYKWKAYMSIVGYPTLVYCILIIELEQFASTCCNKKIHSFSLKLLEAMKDLTWVGFVS